VPRPRSNQSTPNLSPGQASYVLERLIADRRVSAGEINRYVSDMHQEIDSLTQRLESLRSAAGGSYGSGGGAASGGAAPRRRPGRPPGRPRASESGAGAQGGEGAATGRRGRAGSGGGRRRSSALTAEQLASRQLQGRYLGLIRQIPASKRGQYQKIAKEQNREAAIKAMQEVLHK
jgi:hypothetical protein